MKTIYRIPAKTQYGYIEIEGQVSSPEEALEEYERIVKVYNAAPSEGLETRVFDSALDRYLCGKGMDAEAYGAMSKIQIDTVQTIKRSLARIKRRNETKVDNFVDYGEGSNGNGQS